MNVGATMTQMTQRDTISLSNMQLPRNLVDRLRTDSAGIDGLYERMPGGVGALRAREPNSSYCGMVTSCCCSDACLVQEGHVGVLRTDDEYSLLAPGYHSFSACGTEYLGVRDIAAVNVAITFGASGFVTVTEGFLGLMLAGPAYRVLAPGTYQWNSPAVRFLSVVDLNKDIRPVAKVGPFAIVTVPDGDVAVTYHNGQLRILGADASTSTLPPGQQVVVSSAEAVSTPVGASQCRADSASELPYPRDADAKMVPVVPAAARSELRTFFLDDPNWTFTGLLSQRMQTDRLDSNDLLSKDNVELIMVAMSQWCIVDPALAVTRCGPTMDVIRDKINALVRATIARIVAGTCIGAGPVSGGVSAPIVVAQAAGAADGGAPTAANNSARPSDDEGLARLMQSHQATHHMAELSRNVGAMGVNVVAVFVPEKRMKNDDTRKAVASQAVIGIQAEAERSAADAKAYATVKAAVAEAEAIEVLARAHADAGARLGDPKSTAARLALTEVTAKTLDGAKMTVFSGTPGNMPFLLTDQ